MARRRAEPRWRACVASGLGLLLLVAIASAWGLLVPAAYASPPAATRPATRPAAARSTASPIPTGSLFVAVNGSDGNSGSVTSPYATILHAVQVAPAGATIVVRGGTYRETLGNLTKRVTIESYPNEPVWLKGSIVVTGFAQSGTSWVRTGWSPSFCRSCYDPAVIDPRFPAAGLPDQVFIDGWPVRQVTSAAQVTTGTFFVDTTNHRLVLGSDPTGHVVESTVYDKAMQFAAGSAGSVVRGIGIADYAAHYNMDLPAMVIVNAIGVTLDHDTFAWSASRGVSVFKAGAIVTNSAFLYNGANGMHGNLADLIVVANNRFAHSNEENFSFAQSFIAQTAAIKLTSTANALIYGNTFDDNNCNAVWFDVVSSKAQIANNVMTRNAGFGVEYENSNGGIIAGNLIVDSGWDGIKTSGAHDTAIWNNTVVNSGWAAIGIYNAPRTSGSQNVTVYNNVFVGAPVASHALFESYDANTPRNETSPQMISNDDHNLWARPTATQPQYAASWQMTLTTTTRWPTIAALSAATGRESTSVVADGVPLASLFVDPAHGDYTPIAGSPPLRPGTSIPTTIAAAMGLSPGVAHLGALVVTTGA